LDTLPSGLIQSLNIDSGLTLDDNDGYDHDIVMDVIRSGWTRVANINDAALVGVSMDIYETHLKFIADHPELFGIEVGNADLDRGYITAPSVKAARYAARWLVKNSGETKIMDVEILDGKNVKLNALTDQNLERFGKGRV